MTNIERIQQASQKFKTLFTGLMVVIPIAALLLWLGYNQLPDGLRAQLCAGLLVQPAGSLSLSSRLLACLATLLPVAVAMLGCLYLIRLFGLYQQGRIFSGDTTRCYRSLGYVIIASVVIGIVHNSMMSVIVTLDNPPGQRLLSVGFSSADFSRIVIGLLVLVVAWVMDLGRELHEEQQLTV
ncbi:MAG TPA: DUF2975 domain-containing protein [bacterium]|nr:DUF2975 domain-containing protein [bacterium]